MAHYHKGMLSEPLIIKITDDDNFHDNPFEFKTIIMKVPMIILVIMKTMMIRGFDDNPNNNNHDDNDDQGLSCEALGKKLVRVAVSYTHLTLPTIYSV